MAGKDVRLKVTAEKFDEVFSVDEWFRFYELTNEEIYNKMLLFVVDENDNPVTIDEAKKLFRKVPKKDWGEYVTYFYRVIGEAFVSPTSGGS